MHPSLTIGRRPGLFSSLYKVSPHAQLQHLAIFGPTGSGKSTLLTNLAVQNAALSYRPGFLLIDLKDTLALEVASFLPPNRENDVILFDLSDTAYPVAFNPLAGVRPDARTIAAAELVSSFRRLWGDTSWGARLEHVLRNAALTLLETPDATLLDIIRLLTEEQYRTWAVSHVANFSVRHFWDHEFTSIVGTRGSVANVESILNKLSIFSYPEIRNVLGQPETKFSLTDAMQQGKIILAHLPQGVLGEDASAFMASLLVSRVQLAAQRRVTLPHQQRKPFFVLADEFQNYDTSAFVKLITEGRSMAVGVLAACQFEEQLPSTLRQTMQHNCRLKLSCRYAHGAYTIDLVLLQQDPKSENPTLLNALPPPRKSVPQQLQFIQARARKSIAQPRHIVEEDIERRFTYEYTSGPRARFFE
jgi:type IV secretory pathway TraG/TraD family ATPase VirD4